MMEPIVLNHFGRRTKLIEMLKERRSERGVEVGTDHGEYAKRLLEGIPTLIKLFCVDPYVAYTEGNQVHSQEEVDQIHNTALNNIKGYNASIIATTSMDAVRNFTDESLDFVFIDGNHDYYHVRQDINEWAKKVKPGGIVCGHDYKVDPVNDYGVIEAVNEYVAENHIAPFFILHAGGRLVDCWMFIKQ